MGELLSLVGTTRWQALAMVTVVVKLSEREAASSIGVMAFRDRRSCDTWFAFPSVVHIWISTQAVEKLAMRLASIRP
jgi:hypothetical protein